MTSLCDELTHPPAVRPGDRVRVVSPSGPVVADNIEAGLELLKHWQLDVVVDDAVFRRHPPFEYLAGSDARRLDALTEAFADPDCRAVICSRGGYGAMRLLEDLDIGELVSNPKLLVGFSDITALHLAIAGIGGLATLHAPVLKSIPLHGEDDPHETLSRLENALFATAPAPQPFCGLRTVCPGTAHGPVFGGNLSLIVPMLATPYAPSLDGAILIVEDVGEEDYRVDRLFTALRLADDADIAGLVLGDFTDCTGAFVNEQKLHEFIDGLGAEFDCPVVANAPVGHASRNACFPVGVPARLDADAGTLTFDRHAASVTDDS